MTKADVRPPRASTPGEPNLALTVYVPTLLLAFAQGVTVPTMPLYAASFESSFSLISLAVGALPLGTLIADLPTGMVLERIGRRPMMLLGAAMLAASYLALALAQIFPELIFYRIVGGVGTSFWAISRLAFLAQNVPIASRGRSLSTFGGMQRVGTFLGPAAGGLIATLFGLRSAFVLAAVLAGLATIVSVIFIPGTPSTGAPRGHLMRWRMMARLLRPYARDVVGAASAQVFAQMIRSGRQVIVPLYGAAVLGLDVGAIGTIVSVSAAIDMSLFLPAGMLMDRLGRKFAAIPSFVVMAIGMAMIPLSTAYLGLLAATAVIGLGNGLGSGSMMTLGADLAPREATGEFLGLWRVSGDSGQIGGPLVVGGMADLLGLGPAALALAGIGVGTAIIIYFFVAETLKPPGSPADAGSG